MAKRFRAEPYLQEAEAAVGEEDSAVVQLVNKIILDAYNRGASDIHIEPYEKSFRIRFRQDGVLHEVAAPPVTMASAAPRRMTAAASPMAAWKASRLAIT